uniref:C-type lectin domain-containing protein n=1 Tax=Seriola lalandi dorsalis TaxID=1841481 RepID=A0A3B4WVE2_SERLL
MGQDGDFKWVDKSTIEFSNYGPGWPRNTAGVWDCGQIFTGRTCTLPSSNVKCVSITFESFASDSHCDPGYLLYGDFCYHFETESVKNWHDAEAHCSSEQGHLASFHSQEDLKAWVGLNDINVENQFVYTDGSAADFLLWGPNQPDNWQNNEDCVHLRGMNHQAPGKLNDDSCTSTKEYICKKGLIFSFVTLNVLFIPLLLHSYSIF